jgi:hypothetical protein
MIYLQKSDQNNQYDLNSFLGKIVHFREAIPSAISKITNYITVNKFIQNTTLFNIFFKE